jgi:hypothetical protein
MAVLILKETLTVYKIIGMGLMVIGLVLVQVRKGNIRDIFNKIKGRLNRPSEINIHEGGKKKIN